MDVKEGKIKYKDRDDIKCIFGYDPATNITYYFMDPNDEKKFANGNRIATTVLVEAVDSMVKCEHIGIIDPNGNVVIPFENKSIKPLTDSLVIVEKATPVSESVINAVNLRNNPESATTLVSTPAKIKDSIYKEMGTDGKFVFNDQFSEATIYDIYGNNVINNALYSFIAMNDAYIYLSSNVPDSQIYSLGYAVDNSYIDNTNVVATSEIDVENVEVPQENIENALNANQVTENALEVVDNVMATQDGIEGDLVTEQTIENVAPPTEDVFAYNEGDANQEQTTDNLTGFGMDAADMALAANSLVADDIVVPTNGVFESSVVSTEQVAEEFSTEQVGDVVADNVVTEEVVVDKQEVALTDGSDITTDQINDNSMNTLESVETGFDVPLDLVGDSNDVEVRDTELNNVSNDGNDNLALYAASAVNSLTAEETDNTVNNVELANDITADQFEEAPDLDALVEGEAKEEVTDIDTTQEEVKEEVSSEDSNEVVEQENTDITTEVAEEEVKDEDKTEEDVKSEDTPEINNIFEKFADEEDENEVTDTTEVKEENVTDEVVEDNSTQDEIKSVSDVIDDSRTKVEDDIFGSFMEPAKSNVDDISNIRGLVDTGFDDVFKPTNVKVDSIDRSSFVDDSFLDSYVEKPIYQSGFATPSVGNAGIMGELAQSMKGLIRQNKEQRSAISQYREVITDLTDKNRRLTDANSMLQRQNEELSSKVVSFEAAMSKVKVRYDSIQDKVRQQEDVIARQAQEIETLRPQIEAQNKLADILNDVHELLGDTSAYDIDSPSYYRAA